jgi:hypothetical protein
MSLALARFMPPLPKKLIVVGELLASKGVGGTRGLWLHRLSVGGNLLIAHESL